MSPAPSYFDKATTLTNGRSTTHVTPVKPRHDGFGTRAIHVGSEPDQSTGAVIPTISLATTYKQDGVGIHKVRIQSAATLTRLLTCRHLFRVSSILAPETPTGMPWRPLLPPSRGARMVSLSPRDRQPPPR